ncbi:MAG: SIMPL domain-containing protein [Chloroflexota bacterium]|nr:MAG: hypothetical protein DIU80_10725 [Chloroflexota bacterium]
MSQRVTTALGITAVALLLALLAGVVGMLYARPVGAQTATGITGMRQVTVQGHGEATGRPDTATVQIGVETQASTAAEATEQNNAQAQAIIQRLRDLGVAEKDIQTSNFSVMPIYGDDGRQVTGYRVSNIVSVTIRNLDEAGALLDQVVEAGANSIYGVSFSVEDPEGLLNQAREQAVQNARARAETLARAAGGSLGQVLVVSDVAAQPPIPMPMVRAEAAQAVDAVPVQPGEQRFSVDVYVTFELR